MKFKVGDRIKCILSSCDCGGLIEEISHAEQLGYKTISGEFIFQHQEDYWELIESPKNLGMNKLDQSKFYAWKMEQMSKEKINYTYPNSIKCECGSESVGSSGHFSWCPKHGV